VAAPERPGNRLPLNLAIALDTSGSMHGAKLARAQDAAGQVIRQLTAVDRVALVTYDDAARVVAPATLLSPTAKTDFLYRLARIEAGGWTNLAAGYLTACQEAATDDRPNERVNRVLILSDGLANVGQTDPASMIEHARALHERGIATSTMGVGADFNDELLEGMAGAGGGRFQFVESARHVPDAVQGEVGELLTLAARKVAVEVRVPPGVSVVECLHDHRFEPTAFGARIYLDDLIAGDARRVLLRLAVPPPQPSPDMTAASGELAMTALALYVDVESGRGVETAFPVASLAYADSATVAQAPVDIDVDEELAVLLAARARRDAVRLNVLGDRRAAASALAVASQALAAAPSAARSAVASQARLLADLSAQASLGFGAGQIKELHYQSYLLRQNRRRY
jgi:Ca-activated chloride channel family protein